MEIIFGCVLEIIACLSLSYSHCFVGYTREKFPDMTSDSVVKIALRNKITCLEAKSKKRTVQVD